MNVDEQIRVKGTNIVMTLVLKSSHYTFAYLERGAIKAVQHMKETVDYQLESGAWYIIYKRVKYKKK